MPLDVVFIMRIMVAFWTPALTKNPATSKINIVYNQKNGDLYD